MARRFDNDADQVAVLATVIALALRGGSTVVAALELSVTGASGRVAEILQMVCSEIQLGKPIGRAFSEAAAQSGSPPLEELLSKLQLANELGAGLAEQLDDLATSLRQRVAIEQLARASASETKMLLPLVFLILPVTVIFALYPSIQILNLQMEGM
jgi:tight adherence protein C